MADTFLYERKIGLFSVVALLKASILHGYQSTWCFECCNRYGLCEFESLFLCSIFVPLQLNKILIVIIIIVNFFINVD